MAVAATGTHFLKLHQRLSSLDAQPMPSQCLGSGLRSRASWTSWMLRGQLRRGGSGAAAGNSKNQTWPFRAIMSWFQWIAVGMNCKHLKWVWWSIVFCWHWCFLLSLYGSLKRSTFKLAPWIWPRTWENMWISPVLSESRYGRISIDMAVRTFRWAIFHEHVYNSGKFFSFYSFGHRLWTSFTSWTQACTDLLSLTASRWCKTKRVGDPGVCPFRIGRVEDQKTSACEKRTEFPILCPCRNSDRMGNRTAFFSRAKASLKSNSPQIFSWSLNAPCFQTIDCWPSLDHEISRVPSDGKPHPARHLDRCSAGASCRIGYIWGFLTMRDPPKHRFQMVSILNWSNFGCGGTPMTKCQESRLKALVPWSPGEISGLFKLFNPQAVENFLLWETKGHMKLFDFLG